MSVRVRFAPSPTGYLHIGGLRTALFNYLFARKNKGTFILRIEDTDQSRYVEEAEKDITDSLKWSGIEIDEGPDAGGKFGPYRQSERSDIYQKYANQLIESGNAYYAFDTPEEIEAMKERLRSKENPNPKYDASTRQTMKNSLTLPKDEVESLIASGTPYVVRLLVPENETVRFDDIIRDHVAFETSELDDQVLLKSDGLPTYHLANVVDDHLMEITHVIRGEEWLSSAPKHILLYNYLGWMPPIMAHLPLIMSPSGGKLSKRKAEELGIPVNVKEYPKQGFEPEALVNFLAFLGWSTGDDREILSMDDLCNEFSLEKVSKSGAIFNFDKLIWYNEQYFRAQSADNLLDEFKSNLPDEVTSKFSDDFLKVVIELFKERSSRVVDIATQSTFLFTLPETYDEKSVNKAWKEETPDLLKMYVSRIGTLSDSDFKAAVLKEKLSECVEEAGVGFGKLMLPLRISITGLGQGPDLFQMMELLGKSECILRIESALTRLA